jgi:hypothetical protein
MTERDKVHEAILVRYIPIIHLAENAAEDLMFSKLNVRIERLRLRARMGMLFTGLRFTGLLQRAVNGNERLDLHGNRLARHYFKARDRRAKLSLGLIRQAQEVRDLLLRSTEVSDGIVSEFGITPEELKRQINHIRAGESL